MSDIEQALAEAVDSVDLGSYFIDHPSTPLTPEWQDFDTGEFAAAILATPSMQAIARQAAIGAAVERWRSEHPSAAFMPVHVAITAALEGER